MTLFRSILIGLVATFVTCWLIVIGEIVWLSHSLPAQNLPEGTAVGYDVVAILQSSLRNPFFLLAIALSFIGSFFWGSRSLSRH